MTARPTPDVPEEAAEAGARAMDANFNPDRYPVLSSMFADYAQTALAAAFPHIRRAVIEGLADKAEAAADDPDHPAAEAAEHFAGWLRAELAEGGE